jgi:hypothetical protein
MKSNENGSVLVMVILIIAVLSILGTAFLTLSVDENRFAIKEHDYQQAYYIARAGAEATAKHMQENTFTNSDLIDILGGNASVNPKTDFGGGNFKTSINKAKVTEDMDSSNRLIIESIGEFKDLTRTVKISLKNKKLFPKEATLISLHELYLTQSSAIHGDVIVKKAFSDDKKKSLKTHIKDNGKLITEPSISFPDPVDPGLESFGSIVDLNKKSLTIHNDDMYDSKNLGDIHIKNSLLTFDLTDDMNIQMSSLDTDNNGNILVKGSGILYLFVGDIDQIRGKIEIEGDAQLLIVNYKADDFTIKTSSDAYIEAFIYAPLSTVNITNKLHITGSILANTISVRNSTEIWYGDAGIYPDDIFISLKSYTMDEWTY